MSDLWQKNTDTPIEEFCPNCQRWWVAEPPPGGGTVRCPTCLSVPGGAVCGIHFLTAQELKIAEAVEKSNARDRLVENAVFQDQEAAIADYKKLVRKLVISLLATFFLGAFYWLLFIFRPALD